jgi:hypothetical protein
MNEQITETIQLGIVFGVIVVFLDIFLFQLPVLAWLALGLTFFFVAAIILESVTRLVPRERHASVSSPGPEDELQHLSVIVQRALDRHDHEAQGVLAEKLRSIALSTVAGRMKLSRREITELAEKEPDSLSIIANDQEIIELLAGKRYDIEDSRQLDELLSKIGGLSS